VVDAKGGKTDKEESHKKQLRSNT